MARMSKDSMFAAVAGAVVCVGLVVGFWTLGSPSTQRDLAADRKRVQDLKSIARAVTKRWKIKPVVEGRTLPETLKDLVPSDAVYVSLQLTDPVTNGAYEYRVVSGPKFELCATFATDSATSNDHPERPGALSFWNHPKGRHCFALDASTY